MSLPSFHYGNFEKLERIVHNMGSNRSIQILDILVPDVDAFIRQRLAFSSNLKELSLYIMTINIDALCHNTTMA